MNADYSSAIRKRFLSPGWPLGPGMPQIQFGLQIPCSALSPVSRTSVFTVTKELFFLMYSRRSLHLPSPREPVHLTISSERCGGEAHFGTTVDLVCRGVDSHAWGASGPFWILPGVCLLHSHHWTQCNRRGRGKASEVLACSLSPDAEGVIFFLQPKAHISDHHLLTPARWSFPFPKTMSLRIQGLVLQGSGGQCIEAQYSSLDALTLQSLARTLCALVREHKMPFPSPPEVSWFCFWTTMRANCL